MGPYLVLELFTISNDFHIFYLSLWGGIGYPDLSFTNFAGGIVVVFVTFFAPIRLIL